MILPHFKNGKIRNCNVSESVKDPGRSQRQLRRGTAGYISKALAAETYRV